MFAYYMSEMKNIEFNILFLPLHTKLNTLNLNLWVFLNVSQKKIRLM